MRTSDLGLIGSVAFLALLLGLIFVLDSCEQQNCVEMGCKVLPDSDGWHCGECKD